MRDAGVPTLPNRGRAASTFQKILREFHEWCLMRQQQFESIAKAHEQRVIDMRGKQWSASKYESKGD